MTLHTGLWDLKKKKKGDQTSETSQQPLGEGTQAARHLGTLGKRRAALRFLLGTQHLIAG